jgi:hypothetical protein
MKPIARLAIPLIALALPAAAATETRDVSGFTALGLAAPVQVELVIGDRESVVLEGDAEALARIDTYVEHGSLQIKRKRDSHDWDPGWKKNEVRARVTAKRIEAIAISGSGDVKVPQLSADSLALAISGSGDIAIGGGKVGNLSVRIAGSGDVKAPKVDAQAVSISISGSGVALVWARQSLAVKVAGSGDVRYYGDPTVAQTVAGSGSVKRLGAAPT